MSTESPSPRGLTAELAAIAVEAGRVIMAHYEHGTTVTEKADRSPVTAADEAAEALIVARLADLAPDVPVLAEEAVAAGRIPALGSRFFLVDPLDGTREFLGRNGEFTVNIALVEDGLPVAGVVFAPALRVLLTGDGDGAREATWTGGADAPVWRRVAARPAATPPVAVASRSHRDAETEACLVQLGVAETRSAGSSLKFCLLARGEADVYPRFGRTMEWDTAAGHAVLVAAGGRVETVDGAPLRYGKKERGYDNPAFIAWGAPAG